MLSYFLPWKEEEANFARGLFPEYSSLKEATKKGGCPNMVSVVTLPGSAISGSRLQLPTSSILDACSSHHQLQFSVLSPSIPSSSPSLYIITRSPPAYTMAVVLKRKRSDSEISTTSSLLSSPLSNSFMTIDSFQSQQQIATPSLFASRTRKRHRDNRPSEADVHREPVPALPSAELMSLTPTSEHTLSLLFSAQNNSHPQPQSQNFEQAPIASIPMSIEPERHQSSLHSFFTIPPARHSSPSSLYSSSSSSPADIPSLNTAASYLFHATNCEDCNASLGQAGDANGMDIDMMDLDVASGGNYACEQCGKTVCHGCAVSNLGEQRRCLNCAGTRGKTWVGGLGWV